MKVYVSVTKEAAGMGGALLAKYAWWKEKKAGSFEDMSGGEVVGMKCVAEPREEIREEYKGLVRLYVACEQHAVELQ